MLDDDGVDELTDGGQPIVRVAAPDLKYASRVRSRIRDGADDLAVVLDITVAVAGDFRSAHRALAAAAESDTVHYAGTIDGLVGLIADIETAGVADGVTLIPVTDGDDARALGRNVLARLALRHQARAS